MSPPPAGWYADPAHQAPLRWWDGRSWTPQVNGPSRRPADPAPAAARRPASWGIRANAYLYDAVPLWLVSTLVFWPLHRALLDELLGLFVSTVFTQGGQFPGIAVLWDYGLLQMWSVAAIPGVLLRVAYDLVTLTRKGASLGQQKVGLRVVLDRPVGQGTAEGLPLRAALVRSLVIRIAAPTVLGWLLVVLWPLADDERRSLADRAAGTAVVDLLPEQFPVQPPRIG